MTDFDYSFRCLWDDVRNKRIKEGNAVDRSIPSTREQVQESFDNGGMYNFFDKF